ncbi:MAG: aminotransferase class IV [Cyclobacteriaceae bacterium]|nr:aminotransferase class IV [Cyclobacteriaceae bacterium]
MKAIFDRHVIDLEKFNPDQDNRAFLYGDGLFETIIFFNGQIRYLQDHYERITEGCNMLSLVLPEYFNLDYLARQLPALIRNNQLSGTVRIKLLVWRKSGGLYEPTRMEAHHLILTSKAEDRIGQDIRRVGFSTRIFNHPTPWSAYKTQSSLPYVLAGIEKKEKKLDDIIITDSPGNISELLYSNIFWIKNDKFYTPSLETGCIRGVMRTCLIRKLKESGFSLQEILAGRDILLDADYVFSANVSGLRPVTGIEDHIFNEYPDLRLILP